MLDYIVCYRVSWRTDGIFDSKIFFYLDEAMSFFNSIDTGINDDAVKDLKLERVAVKRP